MDWSKEDRRHRERLEKQASVGERLNVVGLLNGVGMDDAVHQRSAVDTLMKLRGGAQGRARTTADTYVSTLRAGRVRDADGGMDADSATRERLFGGQGGKELGPREFKAELNLSVEQMRALATALVTHNRYF